MITTNEYFQSQPVQVTRDDEGRLLMLTAISPPSAQPFFATGNYPAPITKFYPLDKRESRSW